LPNLWRAIELFRLKEPARLQLETARAWLQRSGNRPLSVIMTAVDDTDGGKEDARTRLKALDLIMQHRLRLEYVMVRLVDEYGGGAYRGRRFKETMPLLRQLDIRTSSVSDSLNAIIVPFAAPNLHSAFLSLDHLRNGMFSAPALPNTPRFPWAQLTTLFLADFPSKTVYKVLQRAPTLEHCRLRVAQDTRPVLPPNTPIVLSQLHSLIIDDCPRLMALLQPLRVPALKRFCYARYLGRHSGAPHPLSFAFHATGCMPEWVYLWP
jgi:hypothetical protein